MFGSIYKSLVATFLLGIILCGAYPLFIYAVGTLLFHDQATGGIILKNGNVIGARLIGQSFSKSEYFHGRPSSAGEKGYDASNSSGSNIGPTHQKLNDTLEKSVNQFHKENPTIKSGSVPTELVTMSGSGLDPHISPRAALVQADRISQIRHITSEEIKSLIQSHTEYSQLGFLGESVVNVLSINLELDQKYPLK